MTSTEPGMRHRPRRRWPTAVASVLVTALALLLLHGVTHGTFTDTATAAPGVSMARISLTLTTPGGPVAPFQGNGFYPGSVVRQDLALKNDGTAGVASVRFVTSAGSSNVLTSDPVNGLQLTLTYCGARWEQNGSTFTCTHASGPSTLYAGPYLANQPLPTLGSLTTQAHILIAVSLPSTAGNEFQGLSAALQIEFRAEQVPGRIR